MRITRCFGDIPNDAGASADGQARIRKEAALPDIEFSPDSQLVIDSVKTIGSGANVVVWAMVSIGNATKQVYLFTYSPSRMDIPLDQIEGMTVGQAKQLYNTEMNKEFANPRTWFPSGTAVPTQVEVGVEEPSGIKTPSAPGFVPPVPTQPQPRAYGAASHGVKTASKEDPLAGGESDGMTVEDIAKKHGVSAAKIREQITKGIKIEKEHTSSEAVAREISMDHLAEFADYYDRLEDMEAGLGFIHGALKRFIAGVGKDWNYVTPEELNKGGTDKFHIIDIRKPEDFAKGHIKGAKNIFWKDLVSEDNIKRLPKGKRILLVCYVGHTSSQMVVALRLLGYDAMSLKFGMGLSPVEGVPVAGWLDYGYDVVK